MLVRQGANGGSQPGAKSNGGNGANGSTGQTGGGGAGARGWDSGSGSGAYGSVFQVDQGVVVQMEW